MFFCFFVLDRDRQASFLFWSLSETKLITSQKAQQLVVIVEAVVVTVVRAAPLVVLTMQRLIVGQ